MLLPSSIAECRRAVVGRFALYAPRDAGAMIIWRGFLAEPWSPETDLLVAVPRNAKSVLCRSLLSEAGPRIVVERNPLVAVRPAHRGVTVAEILEAGGHARPPLELLALVDRALSRAGLRVLRVTSPHQIVVSWDGEILVDGLDPISAPRFWGDEELQAHSEACILAAIARGSLDYDAARALVDTVAAQEPRGGIVERAILGRFARESARGHVLDDVVDLAEAKRVVARLARDLFPARFERDRLLLEELALLPREALQRWPSVPAAWRADRAVVEAMRRDAETERASVEAEVASLIREAKHATALVPMPAAPLPPPRIARFKRWASELWHAFWTRARVPRVLPSRARPAPRRRRPRRGVNLRPRA